MMKRILIAFVGLALPVVCAETYHVTLFKSTIVQGTELKAGDYQVNLQKDQLVIQNGKQKLEVPVKIEKAEKNFGSTAIRYTEDRGKYSLREIQFGGSKTKVLVGAGTSSGGGQ